MVAAERRPSHCLAGKQGNALVSWDPTPPGDRAQRLPALKLAAPQGGAGGRSRGPSAGSAVHKRGGGPAQLEGSRTLRVWEAQVEGMVP